MQNMQTKHSYYAVKQAVELSRYDKELMYIVLNIAEAYARKLLFMPCN